MNRFFCTIISFLCVAHLFSASMDARVRTVPQSAADSVFTNPKEGLPLVVRHLIQNANGAQAKVKVMHDWICDNIAYDTDMYFSGRISMQDYESVLKKRKGVCSGYVSVLNEMCRLAGIESVGIHGYSKGFGYQGKLGSRPDHEWNAVNIGGKWRLVDCTWDAGHVDRKTWIKNYSDEWLFLEPQYFIYSHLPERDEDQFLKEPISREQFVKEPYVAGKFFRYGFSFGKIKPDYKTTISQSTKFDFGISKSGVSITAAIREADSGRTIKNAVWINRMGNTFTVDFDVPDRKNYRALIFAKRTAEINYGDNFPIVQFEQYLSQAEQLLAQKKITQKEYDFFCGAFFKVDENNKYYLSEDLFATERKRAIEKIFKLLDVSPFTLEAVFHFELSAERSYSGFGNELKYPSCYASYDSATNTKLVSPLGGTLKKGEKVKFEISSKDYVGIGVNVSGVLMPLQKDSKTGLYTAELEVGDVEQVVVFGTSNGKNYAGLWFYNVE